MFNHMTLIFVCCTPCFRKSCAKLGLFLLELCQISTVKIFGIKMEKRIKLGLCELPLHFEQEAQLLLGDRATRKHAKDS